MGNSSAPEYEPEKWADNASNCFEYAINNNDAFIFQPGTKKGLKFESYRVDDYTKQLMQFVIADGALPLADGEPAPKGFYAVAMYVAIETKVHYDSKGKPIKTEELADDYHFVREDADGGLSHKLGLNPVERLERPADGGFPKEIKANDVTYHYTGSVAIVEGGLNIGLDSRLAEMPKLQQTLFSEEQLSRKTRNEICKLGHQLDGLEFQAHTADPEDMPTDPVLHRFATEYNRCPKSF